MNRRIDSNSAYDTQERKGENRPVILHYRERDRAISGGEIQCLPPLPPPVPTPRGNHLNDRVGNLEVWRQEWQLQSLSFHDKARTISPKKADSYFLASTYLSFYALSFFMHESCRRKQKQRKNLIGSCVFFFVHPSRLLDKFMMFVKYGHYAHS